jgi:hypothetical protein
MKNVNRLLLIDITKLADKGWTAVADGGDFEALFTEITIVHLNFLSRWTMKQSIQHQAWQIPLEIWRFAGLYSGRSKIEDYDKLLNANMILSPMMLNFKLHYFLRGLKETVWHITVLYGPPCSESFLL